MATSSSGQLNVALLNINGLRNKITETGELITKNKIDILALCETKLDDSVTDQDIRIEGFKVRRKDRNSWGGGVAIYIKKGISFTRMRNYEHDDIEMIWVELTPKEKINKEKVLVGCCYRPSDKGPEYLERICEKMAMVSQQKEKDIVLLGDFNIDWFQESADKTRINEAGGLTQIVDKISRKPPHKCIDHIYTSVPESWRQVKSNDATPSDHKLFIVQVKSDVADQMENLSI